MLTEFFDSITVISLPQRIDRRREVESEFRRIGLPRTAFSYFDAIRPDTAGGFMSAGYRGAFLSHLSVLRRLAERAGSDLHLVLEDDFEFATNASELLRTLWPKLHDAELLILGVCSISNASHHSKETFAVSPGFEFVGAHAYAVRPRIVGMMAEYLHQMYNRAPGDPRGGPMSPDGAIGWFRSAHPSVLTKLIWPMICGQRPSRTDVHDLRWFDRWPLVRQAVQLLRRFKRLLPKREVEQR